MLKSLKNTRILFMLFILTGCANMQFDQPKTSAAPNNQIMLNLPLSSLTDTPRIDTDHPLSLAANHLNESNAA